MNAVGHLKPIMKNQIKHSKTLLINKKRKKVNY